MAHKWNHSGLKLWSRCFDSPNSCSLFWDRSQTPNVSKSQFSVIMTGLITAARITLRHVKLGVHHLKIKTSTIGTELNTETKKECVYSCKGWWRLIFLLRLHKRSFILFVFCLSLFVCQIYTGTCGGSGGFVSSCIMVTALLLLLFWLFFPCSLTVLNHGSGPKA